MNRRTVPKDRWLAVVASGEDNSFVARAERYQGATIIESEACTHKHKTGEQAKGCAAKLVDRLTP